MNRRAANPGRIAATGWSLALMAHALALGLLAWIASIVLAPGDSGGTVYPAAMAWVAPLPPPPRPAPVLPLPPIEPPAEEPATTAPVAVPAMVEMPEVVVEEDAAPIVLGAGGDGPAAAAFRPVRARSARLVPAPGPGAATARAVAASAAAATASLPATTAGPGILVRTEPGYPRSARRAGRQGTVRLEVALDPDGSVRAVAVAATSGHDDLDAAAVEAVRHWRFAGTGAAASLRIAVVFRLDAANA